MKKILTVFFALAFVILPTSAGYLKTLNTGKNFLIARHVVINGKDLSPEDTDAVGNVILKNGGTIVYKFTVKSLVGPSVTIKHVSKVKGSSDKNAFLIEISNLTVKVSYTSPTSLKNALETLKTLVVTDINGQKCLKGGKFIWVNDKGDNLANTKKSHMAGEIKLLNSSLDKMAAETETELILITPTDWMVESPVIEEMTGTKKLYGQNGYVTCDELKEILTKATGRGVNIKIVMYLNEENGPFKDITGHSLHSPEGMRFLRAALQQWHDTCGLNAVYTRNPNVAEDGDKMEYVRFRNFLDTISPMTGIQFFH